MDEELCWYVLRLSHLPDSPPGVRPDATLGDVSWTNDDLELNSFRGTSEGSAARKLE